MSVQKLRRVAATGLTVVGLATAVLPRLAVKLNARLWLRGFENPGDLEPRDWYVGMARSWGLAAAVFGLVELAQTGDTGATAPAVEEFAEDDAEESDDDGPVVVDIDTDEESDDED